MKNSLNESEVCISFVVSAFSFDRQLEKTLNSILRQPISNREIIVIIKKNVDPGYTITDILCKKEERLSIIYEDPKKDIIAKNEAILHAKGEYIIFVNSGDELVAGAIDKKFLLDFKGKNIDILMCLTFKSNADFERCTIEMYFEKQMESISVSEGISLCAFSLSCFYRKEFLLENDLLFDNIFDTDSDFKFRAVFLANDIYKSNRFICIKCNVEDKDYKKEICVWKEMFYWLKTFPFDVTTQKANRIVVKKIVLSVWHHAMQYIKKGINNKDLSLEFENTGIFELISNLLKEKIANSLKLKCIILKDHFKLLFTIAYLEKKKCELIEFFFRSDKLRKIFEKRKYPLEKEEIKSPYLENKKLRKIAEFRNNKISIFAITIIMLCLVFVSAVFPFGYTVTMFTLIGIIALLIAGIPNTIFAMTPYEDDSSYGWRHMIIIAISLTIIILLYKIPELHRDIIYYFAVLIPILLVQLLYPLDIVKYSLSIARAVSLVIMYLAKYVGISLFQNSGFVIDAIATSIALDFIFIFLRNSNKY